MKMWEMSVVWLWGRGGECGVEDVREKEESVGWGCEGVKCGVWGCEGREENGDVRMWERNGCEVVREKGKVWGERMWGAGRRVWGERMRGRGERVGCEDVRMWGAGRWGHCGEEARNSRGSLQSEMVRGWGREAVRERECEGEVSEGYWGQGERGLPHQLVSEDIFGHFKVVSNNTEHRVRSQSQSSRMIRGVDTNGIVWFLHWAECLKHLESNKYSTVCSAYWRNSCSICQPPHFCRLVKAWLMVLMLVRRRQLISYEERTW